MRYINKTLYLFYNFNFIFLSIYLIIKYKINYALFIKFHITNISSNLNQYPNLYLAKNFLLLFFLIYDI